MTTDYKTLLQQKAELEAKINELLEHEKADAIAQAQGIAQQYGLTQDDVFPPTRSKSGKPGNRSVGQPKFRNPETGATWTGRGKPPQWIAGKDRSAFGI